MKPLVGGTIDIETLPGTYRAFADNFYEASIMKEEKPITLASVVIKPLGNKKCAVFAYWEYKNYKQFVKAVHEECAKYDFLIGHNAKKFDLKQLNSFFGPFGLPRLDVKIVDTLTVARREFRLPSYKLKYLLVYFGIGEKMETGGEVLWFLVEKGDEKARAHFIKYNINDVIQTEKLALFFKEKGWLKFPEYKVRACFSHETGCIRCQGFKVTHRGEKPYQDGWYAMVACTECGKHQPYKWVRGWGFNPSNINT